jgi:hypothetical protein
VKGLFVLPAIAVLTACVSSKPYNPYNISSARLGEVSQICQQVMRLRPSAPLQENLWPGDPDPALETNDYRGCVASLSNSLAEAAIVRRDRIADEKCRASGLKPGSPAFGVCVVDASDAKVQPAQDPAMPVVPLDQASPTHRREEVACAEIGLEPGQAAFSSCLDRLRRTLTASQMNEDYSN